MKSNHSSETPPRPTKIKVTVQIRVTLPLHAQLVDNLHSEEEDLGPCVQIDGQFFRPYIDWMIFLPQSMNDPEEQAMGLGAGWETFDGPEFDEYFGKEDDFNPPFTFEVIDPKRKEP